MRGDIPTFAKEDEIIRAIPILNDVEPFVNLAAEFAQPEIAADYVELSLSREMEHQTLKLH